MSSDPTRPAAAHTPELDSMLLAIVRDGELIRFNDARITELRPGDKVIELRSHPGTQADPVS